MDDEPVDFEEIEIEKNENKDILYSMIKNICFYLIRIKQLKVRLQTIFLNTFNKICKLFLDLIGQDKDNELNVSKLFEYFKEDDLHKVNNIIEFLFSKMHEELISNENNNLNGMISINIDNKSSLLSDIFYFRKTAIKQCKNHHYVIQKESYIMKYILIDYKSLINFKNQKDILDIYDCFDYFAQNNNIEEKCKICSNSIIPFNRIEPLGEIITIILDRGEDFKNNIPFKLDFHNKMKFYEYLEKDSRDKYSFELILFSSFYLDEKKYYSFYKNEDDNNSWYYYDGTNSYKYNSDTYGIPVLLFYKKCKLKNKNTNFY